MHSFESTSYLNTHFFQNYYSQVQPRFHSIFHHSMEFLNITITKWLVTITFNYYICFGGLFVYDAGWLCPLDRTQTYVVFIGDSHVYPGLLAIAQWYSQPCTALLNIASGLNSCYSRATLTENQLCIRPKLVMPNVISV